MVREFIYYKNDQSFSEQYSILKSYFTYTTALIDNFLNNYLSNIPTHNRSVSRAKKNGGITTESETKTVKL